MYYWSRDPQTQDVITKYPLIRALGDAIHGSGVDYDWSAAESKDNIRMYNAFHLMDEYGGYYATSGFVITIPKKNPREFKFNYRDDQSRYYGNKHMIDDYIRETFAYELAMRLPQERRVKKTRIKRKITTRKRRK
jgi:hypothetical protein